MYLRHRLSNGIRLIHRQIGGPVAHCGLMINAGSRDEEEREQGLAHFIEHLIFKGTSQRKAFHILSHMENVGGEINAYTSKEETCLYGSFMPLHYERWFDVVADILFHSTFPQKELLKEKEIILDEINAWKDNPSEQILDDFDEIVFNGHPLGRNILGTPLHLASFDRPMITDFIEGNYATEEMVICSVGNLSFDLFIRMAEKHFGAFPRRSKQKRRQAHSGYRPLVRTVDRKNHQAHCVMGNNAYSMSHAGRTCLSLLNNILGGPQMTSRLNMAVREKHGFCYTIESLYQAYSDSGVINIYFGTDPAYLEKTHVLITKELTRLRHNRLGEVQMRRAKNQLCGQMHIANESMLNEMMLIGKQVLHLDRVEPLAEIAERIEAVSQSDLLEAANEVFDPSQISVLTYMPDQVV